MTRAALLIAAVAVALVTSACDSSEPDRAGGENPAEPPAGRATTLTLANVGREPEVLEGVVRPMLASLDQLGLEGVGVLPGPLRRPLGVRRLAAPPDWSGMRIGHAGGKQ